MAGAQTGPGQIRDFDRVPSYIGEWGGGISVRAEAVAAIYSGRVGDICSMTSE